MHLFGRFYYDLDDACMENEMFQVKHQLNEHDSYSIEPIEYNANMFLRLSRAEYTNDFYARPFVCVMGDPTQLTAKLIDVSSQGYDSLRRLDEIEVIEIPDPAYFKGMLQIRFKNSTNILCSKIEIFEK